MKALGARGGRTPKMTALRRAAAEQDDSLRQQARDTLSRALAGEDVPKSALDAARSLFSYRSEPAPTRDPSGGNYDGPLIGGRRPCSLADVVRLSVEFDYVRQNPELVEACRAVVAAAPTTPPKVS
jgi:plasmid stability protein